MEFHFTFKGMDSSPAIAEYAEKKLTKLEKYFYGPVHAQVVFKREKFREICEVILTGDGERLVVKEETEDIYSSIDFAYESLEKQVKRLKEKKKEIRPPRVTTETRPISPQGYTIQEVEVSPLSTEEAFQIFRKSNDTIFLFYNTDYDRVCCLYRSGDKEIMFVPVLA